MRFDTFKLMNITMHAAFMVLMLWVLGHPLHAQYAKVQILQDADAQRVLDAYKAKAAADFAFEQAIQHVKNKYRLDFEPSFSSDFRVAVPAPAETPKVGNCLSWMNAISGPAPATSNQATKDMVTDDGYHGNPLWVSPNEGTSTGIVNGLSRIFAQPGDYEMKTIQPCDGALITNRKGVVKCFPVDATAEELATFHQSSDPQ